MKLTHFFKMDSNTVIIKSLALALLSSIVMVGCSNPLSSKEASNNTKETTSNTTDTEQNASSLLAYGEAKIDEIEELQIDFPARIVDVNVTKGTIVNKGDVLLTLDFDDYKVKINTLEKELEEYQLELKGLKNNNNVESANLDALSKELALTKSYVTSGQDPDILTLQNNLSILNEDLDQAQKLYESNQALFESGALSENELETSKLAYEKIQQQIENTNTAIQKAKDARQLELSTLQSKLNAMTLQVSNNDTSKASKISQSQVKIEKTLLTLQNMKAKLTASYLKGQQVIAPKDNLIICDVTTATGSSVNGLGQSLVKFMDLNTLYVLVDIPEESLSKVSLNAPVTLKIADKDVDVPITGTISSISNFATEKEGDTVVEAKIQITSGKEHLKPGLSVDAYIEPLS